MNRFSGIAVALGFASCLFAGAAPKGTIVKVSGKVEILQGKNWANAGKYQAVYDENTIRTGKKSVAEMMFDDDTIVRFEENTRAQICTKGKVPEVSVEEGRITSSVVPSNNVAFYVSSPLAIIGVRGTEFTVTQGKNGTDVAVFKGRVEVSDRGKKAKKIRVLAGSQTFVYKGKHPSPPVGLSPEYVKYREKVLRKFIKRVVSVRKNRNKILLMRIKKMKEKERKMINRIKNRRIKIRSFRIKKK